ncbi:MAG TPA: nitroreductase family deazaflavin-dependent oxidoreductase [Stellaceae bacterium]|nr:nitroreductase family deazaflavin-dependent oxidoreductase [Stellaceae bacterium]
MAGNVEVGAPDWQKTHLKLYLSTDGADGHFVDFTRFGGLHDTPCLILKTTGRQSGEPKLVPLIYGEDGGNFVIVASRGGAPEHPAWFLNLEAKPTVEFQVIDKKYRGTARIAESPERERLYAMMAQIYPPYIAYQAGTTRKIPVVVLEPQTEIDHL